MKKIILAFITIITAIAVAGCAGSAAAEVLSSGEDILAIKINESGGSLEDALNALADSGEITIGGSESEYGFYITSVNGREASENEYWAVYTTLGEYDGVSYSNAEFGTLEYDGKTLSSASYGASGLLAVKDEIYVLKLETF